MSEFKLVFIFFQKFDFNKKPVTVFPRIVSAETILFWKLDCGNYSREETIQGRKLLISYFLEAETIQGRKLFKGGNYMRKLE